MNTFGYNWLEESYGSGRLPRVATQGKLHLPESVAITEQLQELAHGGQDDERYPDSYVAIKYLKHPPYWFHGKVGIKRRYQGG